MPPAAAQTKNPDSEQAPTMTDWKTICKVDDIPVLGSRRVARPGHTDVAVFRNGDNKVFALLDRCPHKGGPLSQGIVFGESVACPLHNWTIGLDDGCARAPDAGCTPRFSVRVVDGDVRLSVTELHTVGLGDEPGPFQGGNDAAGAHVDAPAKAGAV